MEGRIPTRLSTAEGRRFGLTVGGAFLALALLLWWRDHVAAAAVLGVIAALLLLGGLLLPGSMGPIYRAWMRLALTISRVTTPILLGIIFFLVITPTGLLARAFGHRPLEPPSTGGLWRPRPDGQRKSDLERQF